MLSNMTPSFTTEEILSQLDECARQFSFPMLDNGYVYLGDTRMSAYRDNERWALVIEVLGYNLRTGWHDGLNSCVHCFGNCLQQQPGITDDSFLSVTADGLEGPTFEDGCSWCIRDEATSIRIRGMTVPLRLSSEQLKEKEIELVEEPQLTGAELLRSLLPEHRQQLFATEEELLIWVPPDLPLLLRLDEWYHPDLADGEMPSDNEAFQLIAEVLVAGDASRYRPRTEPNTHWKNWPEGGSL